MTDRDMLVELLAMALHGNPDRWRRSAEQRRVYRELVARTATPEELYDVVEDGDAALQEDGILFRRSTTHE